MASAGQKAHGSNHVCRKQDPGFATRAARHGTWERPVRDDLAHGEQIYEYIVGSNRDDGQLAFLTQAQAPMFGREELFKRSWSEVSSLFATNRQIQTEVLDMLYRKSYFLVQANWCPDGVLSCKSWIQAARIRYLLLCISLPGNGGVYDFGECNHKNPMEPLCEPGWRYRCVNLGFLTNMASLRHVKLFVHYSVRNSMYVRCRELPTSC